MTIQSQLASFCLFNDPATTQVYTLSLHDALPIFKDAIWDTGKVVPAGQGDGQIEPIIKDAYASGYRGFLSLEPDRKSTRLNSSHVEISYAVFCLKKKKKSKNECKADIQQGKKYLK